MKSVKAVQKRRVRIARNTSNAKAHQWARIVCAETGEILHVGQPRYIKRVAAKKFNLDTSL